MTWRVEQCREHGYVQSYVVNRDRRVGPFRLGEVDAVLEALTRFEDRESQESAERDRARRRRDEVSSVRRDSARLEKVIVARVVGKQLN